MNDELDWENCPHCGAEYNGYECDVCGFCDGLLQDEYETPEGNIVFCTPEKAFKEGYILYCPRCNENIITWWMNEDHGMCVECWHYTHLDLSE